MWTDAKLDNGQMAGFGLGFGVTPYQGHKRAGHSGGAAGFSATISRFVDDKVTVIVLTNADGAGHVKSQGFLISAIANEIASYYFPGN
jgi:D-alanyl-D-alanine carboxypeptidase